MKLVSNCEVVKIYIIIYRKKLISQCKSSWFYGWIRGKKGISSFIVLTEYNTGEEYVSLASVKISTCLLNRITVDNNWAIKINYVLLIILYNRGRVLFVFQTN